MAIIETLLKMINNGENKAFHELYGNNPDELKRNRRRYVDLLQKFSKEFGSADAEFFTSPGRTEIRGNHTDHNWGHVLAGAVNLDNVAVAARNNTNTMHIFSEFFLSVAGSILEL